MAKTIFTDAHRKFVDSLARLRKSKNVTQVELSRRLGRAQSYISNIERGQRRLDVIEFAEIATALGEQPSSLYARLISTEK